MTFIASFIKINQLVFIFVFQTGGMRTRSYPTWLTGVRPPYEKNICDFVLPKYRSANNLSRRAIGRNVLEHLPPDNRGWFLYNLFHLPWNSFPILTPMLIPHVLQLYDACLQWKSESQHLRKVFISCPVTPIGWFIPGPFNNGLSTTEVRYGRMR
jgi:hypothetical protein